MAPKKKSGAKKNKARPPKGRASSRSTARKAAAKPARKKSGAVRSKWPEPEFRRVVLDNGVTVLTEAHPMNRAVSCGVWVERGTRHEHAGEAGLAHFVEHLVFKRTKKRSAYKISRDMEAVGGDLNAYTSRENTAYVTHSLSEHVELSLDVLSDLVCNPSFIAADVEKEKQVVIQEIHMAEDQLEDIIFDEFFESFYPTSALGKPILGSVKSIEEMERKTVLDFHKRQYTAENIIVSVAGNVHHGEVADLVSKYLKLPPTPKTKKKKTPRGEIPTLPLVPGPNSPEVLSDSVLLSPPEPARFREVIRRSAEQVHVLVGYPSINFRDPHRFEAMVVNTLLGGGMTSRLYQEVREERGLVYSIFSQLTTFADTGMELVYAGTEPKNAPEVIEIILRELRRLKKHGIKRADLDLFKTQVKGSILLGADDIENRMNSLAVNEMMFGRYRAVDEVVRDVEKVTLDSVHEYIESKFLPDDPSILLMGGLPEGPTKKWLETL
jgi:predicted Zn-dependent peptidase